MTLPAQGELVQILLGALPPQTASLSYFADAADQLLARLRPGWTALEAWKIDAEQTLFRAGEIAGELSKALAESRADLRVCAEALREAHMAMHRPHGGCADGCVVATVLSRPGVQAWLT